IAVKDSETFGNWLKKFGPEKIILGADVVDGHIAISGWQEQSEIELFDFLEDYSKQSVCYVICTDVSKDGLLAGPAIGLYQQIINHFPKLKLIASGGVTTIEDINKLKAMGVYGVIIGKAIYEGNITLKELSTFI
ncbi:MAG: HisA/HisF-related TIM barrel protein, partial [Cyclobacteriaceae bacterium]